MEAITVREITEAVGGELIAGDLDGMVTGVSTDTRTLQAGDVFFALIGENADGHKYVPAAVDSGASCVVVSQTVDIKAGTAVVRVPDVLVALGDLAACYRKRFNYRTVGVTGSVGKTTTKEMIAQVLAVRWNVLRNTGNFNNEIGLPHTIFGLTREHQVAVLEMAMRGPGEIRRLCEIAGPDTGVITNIGITHIERLGSRDAIARAKAELLEELPDSGCAVLNSDDDYYDYLHSRFHGRKITYGCSEKADVYASDVLLDTSGRPRFTINTPEGKVEVALGVVGEHNVVNALAAVAVGIIFGVPLVSAASALSEYIPPDKRANLVTTSGGATVLDDTYNASPASVTSALKTLKVMAGSRKIAVLGDMLELGDYAADAHIEVGKAAVECGISRLITVGPISRSIVKGAVAAGMPATSVTSFDTSEEAGMALKVEVGKGDVVLVKGSRAMKMEKVVEALIED